jgi:hypothetical protein
MRAICAALAFLLAWSAIAPHHVHAHMAPAPPTATIGHTR